jgi:phosphoribosylformylglycinamidine cyclo-ligase
MGLGIVRTVAVPPESSKPNGKPSAYQQAGVDIDAQERGLAQVKKLARATFTPGVLSEIGSFGGLFRPDLAGMTEPVLVASADGVGTKLAVARLMDDYSTVGRDLVNHCVNDILVQGAVPLFFLDYVGAGVLAPERLVELVRGVAAGCKENGCALLGGETAEMPGFYQPGDYELVGFIVGIVDRPHLLDGSRVAPGDVLVGLPSAGLHTNGYSLARRVFFETCGLKPDSVVPELGASVAEALMAVHRSYLRPILPLVDSGVVKGMAHITGGGITENLPRVLPPGCAAEVDRSAWTTPPLFSFIAEKGRISDAEMLRAFNMGIGLIVVCAAEDREPLAAQLAAMGEAAMTIGRIVAGDGGVRYVS